MAFAFRIMIEEAYDPMYEQIKTKLEKREWSSGDVWDLVLAFDRFAAYWARRCEGGGVEFDDLYQEARIAMFHIIRRCRHRELVAAYIARSLPGRLKDAAAAMRRGREMVSLEEETCEAEDAFSLPDREAEREAERCEL